MSPTSASVVVKLPIVVPMGTLSATVELDMDRAVGACDDGMAGTFNVASPATLRSTSLASSGLNPSTPLTSPIINGSVIGKMRAAELFTVPDGSANTKPESSPTPTRAIKRASSASYRRLPFASPG